ncbi:MAG: substrate-binding domain-containing protein, partial [Candidatus Eremiobacteraeota bacterium]|nr:substrate-binding domain-containing protein [Candidatus Eremiobacteraeota bacterium]
MLRILSSLTLAAALAASLAGCGGSSTSTSTSGATSGSLKVAGSTALLPLIKQASADYQAAHSDVKISVSGGGSRVGITQAAQGVIDIGDSDIPPAGEPSLVDHHVAVVTFGVVTHPAAGVKNLSLAQIRGIFSGTVKNWKEVGGSDQAITIVNRPRSSGTRAVFVAKLMGGTQPSAAGLTQDSSGTVATIVAQTPGAVSYVS